MKTLVVGQEIKLGPEKYILGGFSKNGIFLLNQLTGKLFHVSNKIFKKLERK